MDERGGGRGHYRGGGRHNHRYRGRGRGRGRGYRQQPYNNNRSRHNNHHGGRGRGRPGNRFNSGSLAQQDPQTAMLRQVYSFVSRVGEFKNISQSEPSVEGQNGLQLRPVEATTARNINDLVNVLCSEDKLDMLFKCQPASTPGIKAEDKIGNLGRVVISCAASLPLQTACYAALTLALHDKTKGCQWEGFASRCVGYAMHNIFVDLDMIICRGKNVSQAACRMKLLLRYLALLGRIGIVQGYDEAAEGTLDVNHLTIFGLLSVLLQTAKASKERKLPNSVVYLLISLVLATLPYATEYIPQEAILSAIIGPMETLFQTYKSTFTPGIGCTSILLKGEQDDGDDMSDDDEDDDEEDDDDDSGQICDSLEDLYRIAKNLQNDFRFTLPKDSPWKGLIQHTAPNGEIGTSEMQNLPVTFSDEKIYLSVAESNAIGYLANGQGEFKLVTFNLDGVVFGRLPIFGAAHDPDDEEDDIEEEEAKNEQLQGYHKNFGLSDRFFVADILRDCLISHETFVNHTGLQLGSPKSVAEELLSVSHLFSGENSAEGMAYAVVETVLGLVIQSRGQSMLKHTYLSRVLLELTKLRPLLISPALAVAMTNIYEDYLPALVPVARDNISRWFAFHLSNTDYQWPSAYWQLWEPYALSKKTSSRGYFVIRAVQLMLENVSDPTVVIKSCLASVDSLAEECFSQPKAAIVQYAEGARLGEFETEIDKRIWDQFDSPDKLEEYLLGSEISDLLLNEKGRWLKTVALARVLVAPLKNIHQSFKDAYLKKDEDEVDQMIDDTHESNDYYNTVTDAIEKYGRTFVNILKKESEIYGDATEGGAFALSHVEEIANFNSILFQGLITCFRKNSVFEGIAIVRWSLGDFGEITTGNVVQRWWEFASDALQTPKLAIGVNDGMIIDGNAAELSATSACEKILTYTVSRVCSLLRNKEQKRLDPMQVDLLEGIKCVVLKAKCLDKEGTKLEPLVQLCSESGGSMAVELLKRSLMQL